MTSPGKLIRLAALESQVLVVAGSARSSDLEGPDAIDFILVQFLPVLLAVRGRATVARGPQVEHVTGAIEQNHVNLAHAVTECNTDIAVLSEVLHVNLE